MVSASSEKEEAALQDVEQTQDFSEEPAQEGKLPEPRAPWKEGTVTPLLPMTVPGSPETCVHSQGLARNLSSTTKAGLFAPEQHESWGLGGGGLRAEAKGH